ncbi:hypothetical protein DS2_13899 [Catenovulum agarivorans DS-2]|uniref:Cytochrome C Planctomycete-type domain-containing protein n=1 Tax=Catenovulum agarivorans DS-2 TaxID=1328313 RepID=W7QB37_9ALTE|nr:c-type cytochrome domain-containing protein [Catenovulum agarivorans]EWH09171.1 hypothetical protein DS2_13899 [Catenovulum agarivorans DS-2]
MDLGQFFGRFHVLVLHLPIGILMLAALFEIYTNIKKQQRNPLLNWVWFWGAMSAIVACVLGYLLSLGGGYSSDAVFIHRTFGISVAVISIICWLLFSKLNNATAAGKWIINTFAAVQLLLLFSTGHYGANMTHGETYLVDHAPDVVRVIVGLEPHPEPREPVTSLSNALIYEDVIAPMMKQRCASCHNDAKQKGKLNLANLQAILKGGKSGPAVTANNLAQSELYKRITLAHGDKKFMPAEGKTPLTDEQVKSIAWWINAGLPTQGFVGDYVNNKDDKKALQAVLGLAPSEFDLPPVEMISQAQYNELNNAGFVVKQIAQGMNYLDIDYSSATQPINQARFELLKQISGSIVYLNLRRSGLTNELAGQLSHFTNLKKLRLDKNPIGDAAIAHLQKLSKLSYLNLYGTQVSNASLEHFGNMPSLAKLYVGETQITANELSQFIDTHNIYVLAANTNNSHNNSYNNKNKGNK